MRQNMNKLLALALTAALCLSLLPGTALAEGETLSGTQKRNGLTVTADGEAQFTYEAGSGFTLGNGSYTVSGTWGDSKEDTIEPPKAVITVPADVTADVTLKGVTIDVTGIDHACAFAIAPKASAQVTLVGESILKSGSFRAGLEVSEGAALTIGGDGSISANGGTQSAAIGGSWYSGYSAGEITINGGTVLATGGGYSAGIGGGGSAGFGGSGGKITINGGAVTATSGGSSAGIGGAWGKGGEIAIHGGEVTATGEVGGAGIGGGVFGAGGAITITGGSVTATGSYADRGFGSAGIGGGSGDRGSPTGGGAAAGGAGGTIVITGTAQVTAIGGDGANSVGPGNGNTNFDTYIRTVALKEGSTAKEGTADNSLLLGAAGNTLEVKGTVSLPWDLEIPTGTTLTIPGGASLTIPKGITLTNNGIITGAGILTGDGVFDGDGDYQIKMSLTTAAVTGLTPPAAGAAPDTDAEVADGANYSVASVTWWSSEQTPHTGNFDYETAYTARVTLKAKNAYAFTDAVTGTINGETAAVDGSGSSVTLSYTFPATGSAPYIPSTYAITPTAGEGGTIAPAKQVFVRSGKNQTFTITPAEGYAVADVLVDGKSVGAATSYTFEKVKARHTIEAVFAPAWENPFTDVTEADWFYEDVAYVHGKGLMLGTAAATFAPDAPVTRATLVTTLWRLAGALQGGEGEAFTDIPGDGWYADAVRWAAHAGITQGVGGGRFDPNAVVTREQVVTILHRFAQYQGKDVSAGENTNILSYTDAFDIAEWATLGFQWACGSGLVEGVGGDRLAPQGQLTRAQLAALLHRYMEA